MLCRKCQKTYIDSENFNWSCRTHKAEFGGDMWWCCGRGKDAPGCQVSKHQSKDDDEDNEPRDQEENERRMISSIRCSVRFTQSCKALGHKASECPKDPNIRSTFDMEEELKRITDIRNRKKQESNFEVSQLMANIFKDKFGDENYELMYGSSLSVTMNSEEDVEERPPPPPTNFSEIIELKEEVGSFHTERNLVQVELFHTKESEKEQQSQPKGRAPSSPVRSDSRKLTLKQRMQLNRE